MPHNPCSLNKLWRTAEPNGATLYSRSTRVDLEYFILATTHLNILNWQKSQMEDWIFNTEFVDVVVFVVAYNCFRL